MLIPERLSITRDRIDPCPTLLNQVIISLSDNPTCAINYKVRSQVSKRINSHNESLKVFLSFTAKSPIWRMGERL